MMKNSDLLLSVQLFGNCEAQLENPNNDLLYHSSNGEKRLFAVLVLEGQSLDYSKLEEMLWGKLRPNPGNVKEHLSKLRLSLQLDEVSKDLRPSQCVCRFADPSARCVELGILRCGLKNDEVLRLCKPNRSSVRIILSAQFSYCDALFFSANAKTSEISTLRELDKIYRRGKLLDQLDTQWAQKVRIRYEEMYQTILDRLLQKTQIRNSLPSLTISGSKRHLDAPIGIIDRTVIEIARSLTIIPMHVFHGPAGIGIEVIDTLHNTFDHPYVSSEMIYGNRERLISNADYVIVVGGSDFTEIEVKIAIEQKKKIIPIPCTGGAARNCYHLLSTTSRESAYWMLDDDFIKLATIKDPQEIGRLIQKVLLRDLAPHNGNSQSAKEK